MKTVVKISGSVFDEAGAENRIIELASVFERYVQDGNSLALVVGGGKRSRELIELGRKLGATEDVLDEIGIDVTRINAKLLMSCMKDSYPKVITDLREADIAWSIKKIPVAGGLSPGHSTNAVAALLAEHLRADLFINSTKAGGIFDRDPKKYPDARLMEMVDVEKLKKIIKGSSEAGTYELLDEVSIGIIERSKIRTLVTGTGTTEIKKALYGEKVGSMIVFERI